MNGRTRGLAAAVLGLLLLAVAAWLVWPGGNLPLATLFRRDQTWQQIQERDTWRVGMDPSFPPFEVLDQQGKPVGFDVDLVKRMAATWGVEAEIVAMGFDSLIDALKAAKIDSVVSAYPFDPRLTRDVAFSTPYFDAGLRMVVRKGSTLAAVDELGGKRVAVEWGSVGDMIGRRLQREGIALELIPFETPHEVLEALGQRSEIEAALIDNVTLSQAQAQGAQIVGVGTPLESNPYVIVAPLRATDLQQRIEEALQTLQQNDEIAGLERQWFAQQ